MTIVADLIALQQHGLICKVFRALVLGGVNTPKLLFYNQKLKKDAPFGYGFL